MRIKQAGVWRAPYVFIKQQGRWYYPYRTLVKRNGVWKDDYLRGMLNSLYNGTVTVGSYGGWEYTAYGWAVGALGATNNDTTKFVNKARAFITGTKPYYSAPPLQWLELFVEGDLTGVANQIGDITVNGIYGRLVSVSNGNSGGASTFIGWVFDQPLPTSGQWVINT